MKHLLLIVLLVTASHAEYVQKNYAIIPGLYQLKTGQQSKGDAIILAEVITVASAGYLWIRHDPDKWEGRRDRTSRYSDKGYAAWKTYQRKYEQAQKGGDRIKYCLWAASGVYVFNFVDALLWNQERSTTLAVGPRGIQFTYHF